METQKVKPETEREVEELIGCLETQLTEMETIECIFTEDEIEGPWNQDTISQMKDICVQFHDLSDAISPTALMSEIFDLRCLSFDLNIQIPCNTSCLNVNMNFSLPHGYPKVNPKVYISSNVLSRAQQSSWNDGLVKFIEENSSEEPMVYQIVDWAKENAKVFVSDDKPKQKFQQAKNKKLNKPANKSTKQAAMWLYMHHIYNKEKRKDIINWAKELELTGFSLPGKPGVVYVEGNEENIDIYFARLKRLSWKRMSCIQKDELEETSKKFVDFQELNFDPHGSRDYHMDLGKFHIFLKENGLGSMFAVLFGIKDE